MPLYEYHCDSCGEFEALGRMSESSLPAKCPECGRYGSRIVSAPRLAILGSAQRSAFERNEKSANEPKVTRRSSCGCSGAHTCSSSATKTVAKGNKNMTKQNGLEMQTKRSSRPWMLGH